MTTPEYENLEKILREIEPDHVPSEFISAARITDNKNRTYFVTRDEIEEIMLDDASLEDQGITSIQFILDLNEIKDTIIEYSEFILKDIAL